MKEELEKLLEFVKKHGWIQGEWVKPGDPPSYCLSRSVGSYGNNSFETYCKVKKLIQDTCGYSYLPEWNDKPGRTKEDVINLIQKAIDNLDGTESINEDSGG
jgi:hypothetical protein